MLPRGPSRESPRGRNPRKNPPHLTSHQGNPRRPQRVRKRSPANPMKSTMDPLQIPTSPLTCYMCTTMGVEVPPQGTGNVISHPWLWTCWDLWGTSYGHVGICGGTSCGGLLGVAGAPLRAWGGRGPAGSPSLGVPAPHTFCTPLPQHQKTKCAMKLVPRSPIWTIPGRICIVFREEYDSGVRIAWFRPKRAF